MTFFTVEHEDAISGCSTERRVRNCEAAHAARNGEEAACNMSDMREWLDQKFNSDTLNRRRIRQRIASGELERRKRPTRPIKLYVLHIDFHRMAALRSKRAIVILALVMAAIAIPGLQIRRQPAIDDCLDGGTMGLRRKQMR